MIYTEMMRHDYDKMTAFIFSRALSNRFKEGCIRCWLPE